MGRITVPTEREERILRENHLDPREYGVTYRDEKTIRLICYRTRDSIVIQKGDRKW